MSSDLGAAAGPLDAPPPLQTGVAEHSREHSREGSPGPGPGSLKLDQEQRRRFNNAQRREKSKQNKKARREEREQQLQALVPEQAAELAAQEEARRAERLAKAKNAQEALQEALRSGLRIVIDCSFAYDRPMKEVRSLAKQITLCIGLNKRAARPVALTLTSFSGPVREAAQAGGSPEGWKAVCHDQGTLQAFAPEQVVVLSPDASEPLEALEADKVYVIGGIVDRTVKKGTTLAFAEQAGVQARRLPIAEHAEALGLGKGTQKCPVLNINDVFAGLLESWSGADWVQALQAAIPARKKRPAPMPAQPPPSDCAGAGAGAEDEPDADAEDEDDAWGRNKMEKKMQAADMYCGQNAYEACCS